MQSKTALRAELLARRRAISPVDAARWSMAIRQRLYAMPIFQKAGQVLTYVSRDNEVDTLGIIRDTLEAGRPVLVPVTVEGSMLRWSLLRDCNDLRPGRFGVLEPAMPEWTSGLPDSVCLVPGVGFTRDGHRIGHGEGFFDRFLSMYGGYAIGLAFEAQMVESMPIEPHDQACHEVLTELKSSRPV